MCDKRIMVDRRIGHDFKNHQCGRKARWQYTRAGRKYGVIYCTYHAKQVVADGFQKHSEISEQDLINGGFVEVV